jgi:hypothetical protein
MRNHLRGRKALALALVSGLVLFTFACGDDEEDTPTTPDQPAPIVTPTPGTNPGEQELGHALGLQHSTVPSDMMYYAARMDATGLFTENERLSIRLLLQRKPRNRYPDNDRGSVAAGSSSVGSASETLSIAVN